MEGPTSPLHTYLAELASQARTKEPVMSPRAPQERPILLETKLTLSETAVLRLKEKVVRMNQEATEAEVRYNKSLAQVQRQLQKNKVQIKRLRAQNTFLCGEESYSSREIERLTEELQKVRAKRDQLTSQLQAAKSEAGSYQRLVDSSKNTVSDPEVDQEQIRTHVREVELQRSQAEVAQLRHIVQDLQKQLEHASNALSRAERSVCYHNLIPFHANLSSCSSRFLLCT